VGYTESDYLKVSMPGNYANIGTWVGEAEKRGGKVRFAKCFGLDRKHNRVPHAMISIDVPMS